MHEKWFEFKKNVYLLAKKSLQIQFLIKKNALTILMKFALK